jgi:hypothetical protein
VPMLRAELDRLGNDLRAFYAAMRALADDDEARAALCPRDPGVASGQAR